jgi:imidazolonepropionase-like amidohydrolase
MLVPIRCTRFGPALLLALGLAAPAAGAEEAAVAFTNAVIETAGKAGRVENGTLVLRGGKVEAVGADVKIPDGARVIDARGKTIMPGVLDPFHEVSIAAPTADAAPRVVIGGRRFQPPVRAGGADAAFTRVADNFYPYEPGYRVLLRSGLTGLNLVAGGYGQSAVMRVTPDRPDAMLVNADGPLFTAVANDTTSLDVIRTALETAEKIKKGAPVALPSGPPPAGPNPTPGPRPGTGRRGGGGRRPPGGFGGGFTPRLDQTTLKLWQAVHEGKAPLFANASGAAAIVHLLKAVEPYKDVRVVLAAPGPALYETLDLLAGRPVRVLVRPGLTLRPNTRERVNLARLLHEAGLEIAFTHPTSQADLIATQDCPLFPVAYLVRCGLPRRAALAALTARPAAILGLDKTHGTIEPGKSADLLLFTGDPLDPGSRLTQVLIEGRTVYEN